MLDAQTRAAICMASFLVVAACGAVADPTSAMRASEGVAECSVVGVERSDYTITYTTSNMPDPLLNGLKAKLEVRRVKPIFDEEPGHCAATEALVLVHGRTAEGIPVFDLQYKDYSLMEGLTLRGIDTFAVNLLGYGGSRIVGRDDPLSNACNASLPQCKVSSGSPCAPVAEVCDCGGPPPLQATNQQGDRRYLNPNPLALPCAHSSSTRFQRTPDQVADLDRVVEDVKHRTEGRARVNLLGYSVGGETIGVYLDDETRRQKIERAIFLSSVFGAEGTRLNEGPVPSWPLGVFDRQFATSGLNASCPGQFDPGIGEAAWISFKARDPVGSTWGPLDAEGNPAGLIRFPIVTRWGWQPEATRRVSTPILAMTCRVDNGVPLGAAGTVSLFRNSPQANLCTTHADCASGYICETAFSSPVCRLNNRILVQLECETHSPLWAGVSNADNACANPHVRVRDRVADFILKGS